MSRAGACLASDVRMTADVAVVIAPAVDVAQIARAIATIHIEYQDGERKLEVAEKKTESLRDEQRRRRLEMGRLLIQAKGGIKHGGWLPYLEKLGIEARTAQNWMREAGWVEDVKSESPANDSLLNSRVASGVDKRPRKSTPIAAREIAVDDEPDAPPPSPLTSWKNDLDRALIGIDKLIMGYAKSWPKRSRENLAATLRSIASRIERLGGE